LLTKFTLIAIVEKVSYRSIICCSLSLFQAEAEPAGLPDSNIIFFVATKERKEKKTWARRFACLARYRGNINREPTVDNLPSDPPDPFGHLTQ